MANRDLTIKEWKRLLESYKKDKNKKSYEKILERFTPIINVAITSIRVQNHLGKNFDNELLFKVGEDSLFKEIDTFNLDEDIDYRSYFRKIIYDKILNFIEKNKQPIIDNIDKLILLLEDEFSINIDSKDYLNVRIFIETLPSKVKKAVLEYLGYYDKKYSYQEIAIILNSDAKTIEKVINTFKENLFNQITIKTKITKPKVNTVEIKPQEKVNFKKLISNNEMINKLVNNIITILNLNLNITKEEALIFVFRIFMIENNIYTIKDLTTYFKITEEEINNITKEVFNKLNNNDKVMNFIASNINNNHRHI